MDINDVPDFWKLKLDVMISDFKKLQSQDRSTTYPEEFHPIFYFSVINVSTKRRGIFKQDLGKGIFLDYMVFASLGIRYPLGMEREKSRNEAEPYMRFFPRELSYLGITDDDIKLALLEQSTGKQGNFDISTYPAGKYPITPAIARKIQTTISSKNPTIQFHIFTIEKFNDDIQPLLRHETICQLL